MVKLPKQRFDVLALGSNSILDTEDWCRNG